MEDKKGKKKDKKEKVKKEEQEEETEKGNPIDAEGADVLEAEPRNLLLSLLSQVKIGMDLSRVTLPTFILEPKSFLEKLTDFMTHPDLVLKYFISVYRKPFTNPLQCGQP